MFSIVAKKSRTFPTFSYSAKSRCAGAGREHSQTDSPAGQWKYSIPWMSCSVCEWGWPKSRNLSFFLVSVSLNPPLSGSLSFSGSLVFFWEVLWNSQNSQIWDFVIAAQGLAVNWSSGGEKTVLYIVCFAYLVSSVLPTLLPYYTVFISAQEFPLVSISPPHPSGGKGGVSERLAGTELLAAGLNHGTNENRAGV